jgi:TonB family protein
MSAAALCILISSALSIAQSSSPAVPAPPTAGQTEEARIYNVGPDVTAPDLLPLEGVPSPPGKCKTRMDGVVELSLLVDANGQPRNVVLLRPLENDLDGFALRIAAADRFKPGVHDGAPVKVAASLKIGMKGCAVETEDSGGKKILTLWLRTPPEQTLGPPSQAPKRAISFPHGTPEQSFDRVGQKVSAPVPLNSVVAELTPEAMRLKINGVCMVSVIVDVHGMPQNPRVVKSLDPGLDQNALIAVSKYRFQPAMKDGTPVPVMITIEVNFRNY